MWTTFPIELDTKVSLTMKEAVDGEVTESKREGVIWSLWIDDGSASFSIGSTKDDYNWQEIRVSMPYSNRDVMSDFEQDVLTALLDKYAAIGVYHPMIEEAIENARRESVDCDE